MPANVRAAPSWLLTQNCASGSSISPAGGQSALPENPPAAEKANGRSGESQRSNIPRSGPVLLAAAGVGCAGEALDAALAAFAGVVGRIECDRVGSGVRI
jgi:hypothetical protein